MSTRDSSYPVVIYLQNQIFDDGLFAPHKPLTRDAMEAAISGQAVTAAFQDCYKEFDTSADLWGFGGAGADFLGK